MNIVDSSGWLEYLKGSDRAKYYEEALADAENLIVPTIIFFEVFKKVLNERGRDVAIQVAVAMRTGIIISLDEVIAMEAAILSSERKLPMADAIILATAQRHGAILLTQDVHFQGIVGVKYFPA